MQTQLIYDALSEIAQVLGDSNYNPISTSLLCLRHGISFDERAKCRGLTPCGLRLSAGRGRMAAPA